MKKVAILQSNYIPWKGYFDIINSVDEFIVLDDVQYTKSDWRNRNKIKTDKGVEWITLPVTLKGKFGQSIKETKIANPHFLSLHWKTLCQHYRRSKFFSKFEADFADLYAHTQKLLFLSEINCFFIKEICSFLGIKTKITMSSEFELPAEKTERLISLCKEVGAREYISGPAAQTYINQELFTEAGIGLKYYDYSDYPEYTQQYPPFEHGVTILDLIFNEGHNATKFMKSFK